MGVHPVLDVDTALDKAGLRNERVRAYVREWAEHTRPDRVEVVADSDDERLLQESLAAGEIQPAGEGLYYSRSYVKDTARSEERTIVATSDPADAGVYDNWRPAAEMRPLLEEKMRGASAKMPIRSLAMKSRDASLATKQSASTSPPSSIFS